MKCDLCHFDDQGPACVRTCPTNALMLVDSRDIAQASKRKRQLTFNTDLGDLSLFQAQQGRGNECNWISESGGGVVCRQRRTGLLFAMRKPLSGAIAGIGGAVASAMLVVAGGAALLMPERIHGGMLQFLHLTIRVGASTRCGCWPSACRRCRCHCSILAGIATRR